MRNALFALLISFAALSTAGEPKLGQAGKDAHWEPTPQALVETMLDLAKVTARDYVMDLGSGDGRLVIAAAKRGARGLGIEYDAGLVELSRHVAKKEGVAGKAEFVKTDLFTADLSKATVITLFLGERSNSRLRPKILSLKPGTRIVSNSFTMGNWEEDGKAVLTAAQGCKEKYCTAFLWIVPARIAGSYKLPQGELVLEQEFQLLSGTLTTAGTTEPIVGGRVRAGEISFKAGGREYRGRMNGKTLELR